MMNVLLVFGLVLLVYEMIIFTSTFVVVGTLMFIVIILAIKSLLQDKKIKDLEGQIILYLHLHKKKERVSESQSQLESELESESRPQSQSQTLSESLSKAIPTDTTISKIKSENVSQHISDTLAQENEIPLSQPIHQNTLHQDTIHEDTLHQHETPEPKVESWFKSWITTGNPIAKIGIVILFFGVAFLLKYVTSKIYFPISYRLMLVFLSGILMVLLGWKLSATRKTYANIIQGGGIGLMYLTVYAAFSMYHLLQPEPAFLLLLLIVALSGLIAIMRDAQSIAITGILGGFLAPLLINTGTNNHILLFTYYLILNTGILGVAWFKSWGELNLIGFIFTFVISALWGYQYYQPEYYLSSQIFLIIYFLFYIMIPLLFTQHHAENKKQLVDTTLVFGTPAIVFALQSELVNNINYGLAWGAVILGIFYACLAVAVHSLNNPVYKRISAAYSGLAVLFGTISIPLFFSKIWASSNWALESIVLMWFGIRQQQMLTRLAACIILLASTGLYVFGIQDVITGAGYVNEYYLSGLIVSFANIICSFFLYKMLAMKSENEKNFAVIFFILGIIGWYYTNLDHINDHVSYQHQFVVILLYLAHTSLVAWLFSEFLDWKWLRYPAIALLPMMMLLSIPIFPLDFFHANGTLSAWIVSIIFYYLILYRHDKYPEAYLPALHLLSFMALIWIISMQINAALIQHHQYSITWYFVAWGVVPSILMAIVCYGKQYIKWPLIRYETTYLHYSGFIIIIYLLSWFISTNFIAGDIPSLMYLPIINPLDLAIALAIMIIVIWYLKSRIWIENTIATITVTNVCGILSVIGFIWFNAILLRSLHHWLSIPYTCAGLWDSTVVQACLSIFWTVLALVETFIAARTHQRILWFLGFALIGVVIIKLFLVDLSGTNTLERIITFIGVGVLLLWFEPFSLVT